MPADVTLVVAGHRYGGWKSVRVTRSLESMDGVSPGGLPGYMPCGCYVGPWHGILPPPRCGGHAHAPAAPFAPVPPAAQLELSEADIERIARRAAELVVELLAARGGGEQSSR